MFVGMIGKKIEKLRKRRGWSQRELARRVGISGTHIQAIECGRIRSPRFITLEAIADALGCSRATFFGKDDL